MAPLAPGKMRVKPVAATTRSWWRGIKSWKKKSPPKYFLKKWMKNSNERSWLMAGTSHSIPSNLFKCRDSRQRKFFVSFPSPDLQCKFHFNWRTKPVKKKKERKRRRWWWGARRSKPQKKKYNKNWLTRWATAFHGHGPIIVVVTWWAKMQIGSIQSQLH